MRTKQDIEAGLMKKVIKDLYGKDHLTLYRGDRTKYEIPLLVLMVHEDSLGDKTLRAMCGNDCFEFPKDDLIQLRDTLNKIMP